MQAAYVPSIISIAETLLSELEAIEEQPPQITSDLLIKLHHLFDKNLERALQIIDKGDVKCYVAEKSGRTVYQVKGKTAAEPYTVFPLDYCSCHAFLYDVVGHGGSEQVLCKHQLAARIASALRRCPTIVVPDTALVQLLLTA
ncbi:hypothetical protein WJX81_003142 [Elliptochloris bilobata]|uniref:SWIM-type domain-containing protein n=1 Tax=Elliptochloris bilobata TaxID=381761 RepID=A0AAW1S7A4_9CHLO